MSITTIIGPMFSGKTTELIRLIKREKLAKKKCLVIKHFIDNRFDIIKNSEEDGVPNHITTHDKICYCDCDIIYLSDLHDKTIIDNIIKNYAVVGIDEGFFFRNINIFCNKLADAGIVVIVSTLDSSYKQEIFSEIADLIATSEKIVKLGAVCMICQNQDASFTIRTIDSNEKILVGGEEAYKCVCRQCLNIYKNQKEIAYHDNNS
jgi:thymidine kinase